MGIDLAAIRNRVERLKNNDRGGESNSPKWRPEPGEYVGRVLPWPDAPAGEPFKEIAFYYDIGRGMFPAPESYGEEDAVKELRMKLFQDGSEEMREVAKKLFPRNRAYAPIVIRGEEDEGVRLLDMNKTLHEEMLGLFLDEDVGDYTDPAEGFDIKFTVTEEPLPFGNKTWNKITPKVPRSHKPCPAAKSKKQLEEWNSQMPDLNALYPRISSEEVEKRLDEWAASKLGNGAAASQDTSTGTSKAPASDGSGLSKGPAADLDSVFDEIESLGDD